MGTLIGASDNVVMAGIAEKVRTRSRSRFNHRDLVLTGTDGSHRKRDSLSLPGRLSRVVYVFHESRLPVYASVSHDLLWLAASPQLCGRLGQL